MSRKTFRLQPETLDNRVLPSCWAAGFCCDPPPSHADSPAIVCGGHAVRNGGNGGNGGDINKVCDPNHEAGIIKGCGNTGKDIGDIISKNGCGEIKQDGFPYIDGRVRSCGNADVPIKAGEKGCGEVIDKPPYENGGAGKIMVPVVAHDQVMAEYGNAQSCWVPIK